MKDKDVKLTPEQVLAVYPGQKTNKPLKIGFDLDSVLCSGNITLLRILDFMPSEERQACEEWYYREQKPELNPEMFLSDEDEFIVITGRFKSLETVTRKWLDKFCHRYKKLIMVDLGPAYGLSNGEVVNWSKRQAELKAKVINEEHLDIYFDDNGDTVKWLRKFCTNTKIVKYGGRL